jgi:hypothetical protein
VLECSELVITDVADEAVLFRLHYAYKVTQGPAKDTVRESNLRYVAFCRGMESSNQEVGREKLIVNLMHDLVAAFRLE